MDTDRAARGGPALRRDARPGQALRALPDLLRRGRQARARHGAAAPEASVPGRRPAAGRHRAARLPAGHARVRGRRAPGRGELVLREHRRRARARAPQPARAREPLRASPRRRVPDARGALGGGPRAASTSSPQTAPRRSSSGSSPSLHRRSCPPQRPADEHRRCAAVDHLPLRRGRDVLRRALLALPHRPVRLDQPLHPAARPPRARLGQPRLPLRRAGRNRRPSHRAVHPAVGNSLGRDLRELLPLVRGNRRQASPASSRSSAFSAFSTAARAAPGCGAQPRAWTCSPTCCSPS